MKNKIVSLLLLSIFLISSVLVAIPQGINANSTYIPWYDSDWLYRKSFNVIGSPDGDQTNYQLKVYAHYGSGTDTGFVLREPTTSTYAADAGTNTTTIVDAALTSTIDLYYVGAKVYNSTRSLWSVVTNYVAATKTLTISPAIAAQTTADAYYLYEIPPKMYFTQKCNTDFSDIRFANKSGNTLLDYWIESYTASSYAIIWVEFDSIYKLPTTNTFWVYYGNSAATTASSGANTFIFFDDFERGIHGDNIGGDWVLNTGSVTISTTQARGGAMSARWGAGIAAAYFDSVASNNKAYMFWMRKDNAAVDMTFEHGNGTRQIVFRADTAEDVEYYNGAAHVDTTYNTVADTWRKWEVLNIDFDVAFVYSLLEESTLTTNAATAFLGASRTDQFWGIHYDATAGTGAYVDDFCVRNFTPNEPRWSTFTAEVAAGATQTIQDVAIFQSYLVEDDWLIAIRYLNEYYPYYDTADIRQFFVLQFLNTDGDVVAQTPSMLWGNKVGCIYLNPTLASSFEWGADYTVRYYALFSGNPYDEWDLESPHWQGSDLTYLDSWVLSSANVIETYYVADNLVLTTEIAERGTVLNATGASIFNTGITGLSIARPSLFQTYTRDSEYEGKTFNQTYRQSLSAWQTHWGADGTVMLTRIGNLIGVDGNIVAIILLMIFMILIIITAFPMGHTMPANALCVIVLFAGAYLGLDVAWLGILALISGLLLFKQFWMDKGT